MEEIKKILTDKINKIRESRDNLFFVQIGVYDGKSMDDMANQVIKETDIGVFIEPNHYIFEKLKYNKNNFSRSLFLDFAVLPHENFYKEYFHIQKTGGGSGFVRGMLNKNLVESENFELGNIKTLSVKELLNNHLDFIPDVYFIDCEGYDHDIVLNILEIQKPEMIYFESWNMIDINNILGKKIFTTRDEIKIILSDFNYEYIFDEVGENILAYKL